MTARELLRGPLLLLLASALLTVWLLTLVGYPAAAATVAVVAVGVTVAGATAPLDGYRPRHAAPGRYVGRHLPRPRLVGVGA